jgi:hypothetical protein
MDDKNGGSIVQIDVFFSRQMLSVLIYSVGKVISVAIHKYFRM